MSYPIVLHPWHGRDFWLSPTLSCPVCKTVAHGAKIKAGDLWLTCQKESKHRNCRAHWRALAIHPGMVGGTIAAIFGEHEGERILRLVRPECRLMPEEDVFALEFREPTFLQFNLTLEEWLTLGKDWRASSRILHILAGEAA